MTGSVGIFWILPNADGVALHAHMIPLIRAETYGDCLTDSFSHYDAWESTKRGRSLLAPLTETARAVIAGSEYEDWPRGRVVYDGTSQKFIVYADRQIVPHAPLLRAHFRRPLDVPFRADPHYCNSKRLPQEQPAS